jgi:hypothetical protein
MARVFVSHSSTDAVLAAEVHRWLVEGGREAFLDQDLSDGLVVGEEWERRLHERLRWADAVVCVLTSAYLTSVWCTAELTIAQSRGSRLLPVQAEPGMRHPLLNSVQHLDMTVDAAAARARMAEALLRIDAAGGSGWPPLRQAITAAAAALRARRDIDQAAGQWAEHRHAPQRLWGGDRLAAARADTGARLQTVRPAHEIGPTHKASVPTRRSVSPRLPRRRTVIADRVELSARARDFLTASIRRDRRRRGRAVTILSVLLVLALGAAAFAVDRQRTAENQQRVATARQLLAQAEALTAVFRRFGG